ncbi:hypothetical protein Ato02nite_065990 [Paractinoplanes toevensis]|uniref:SDR family NAD(P)-dependent oxidoreductase n=2 Tax=Paractinoplanes toevensis TaxID=571911 RepID=A0A919W8N6_9ACTN|nr:hypothetical protein Ato02nite_065990 [Actinoplanes toevensis]
MWLMSSEWPWTTSPVCLITGAGRGLGWEAAVELAGRGTTVIVAGRDFTAVANAAARRR